MANDNKKDEKSERKVATWVWVTITVIVVIFVIPTFLNAGGFLAGLGNLGAMVGTFVIFFVIPLCFLFVLGFYIWSYVLKPSREYLKKISLRQTEGNPK